MAISASRPVLDEHGELIGVVASDLFLSQVSDFLRTLKIGTNGQSFIMERSGLLVASSADASPLILEAGVAPRRLAAAESSSGMIRAAAAVERDSSSSQIEFEVLGERHFLQVAAIQDSYGIDWLVAVVIPERDFMAGVAANTRVTLALVLAAAALAVVFSIAASRWVTSPIHRLALSAEALARGEWREVAETSRIGEIAGLSRSFNRMTRQLEQTVGSLETEVIERTRAEERLRASEARYRLLADNAADVIWTMDMDGRFTYVSPSVEKLRGYTPEEVMREPMTAALTPESAAVAAALLAELRNRVAEGLAVEEHFELEQPCKDGTTVWTETLIGALAGEDGKPLGVLGVSRNITARKQAEQTRLALEAKLRQSQKLESIGTLASGIAHEINNPLTGIINYADLVERRIEDPQLREYARGIMSEGNRVAEIVRGLLSFARQETAERRRASMPDVVRATLELIGSVLKRDLIRIEEDVAARLPAVS
jgi:PAS domain S-box-containing protein